MRRLELEALLEAYQEWMKEELPTQTKHCRRMIYAVEGMLEDSLALADNPFLKRVAARQPGEYGMFNPPALRPEEVEVLRRQQQYREKFYQEVSLKLVGGLEKLMGLKPGALVTTLEAPPAPLPLFSQEVPTEEVGREEDLPTPDVVTGR